MKRFSIIFLFIFILTFSAKSQSLFVENFNYTAGDTIGGHGWTGYSAYTNPIKIISPGLTFPGYVNSNIGNAIKLRSSGQLAYKDCSDIESNGSVYLSFMIKVDTATNKGDYFIGLLQSDITFSPNLRIMIRANGPNLFSFGLSKRTGDTLWSTVTYPLNQTIMVVGKYTFVPGISNDILALYVFTSLLPLTEPETPTLGHYSSNTSAPDIINVGKVALRQYLNFSPTLVLDGIQLTKEWPKNVTNVTTLSTIADKFSLSQNYPNPFNPSTTIKFSLPSNGMTSLKVYDLMGKEVSSLVNGNMSAGEFTTEFNGANLASGMYFYKLEFSGVDGKSISEQKKLMLVK